VRENDVAPGLAAQRAGRPEGLAERIDHRPPEPREQLKAGLLHQPALGVRPRHLRHRALDQRIKIKRRHIDLAGDQAREQQVAN